MSAFSDWKCGGLSDDEYKSAMRRECEDYDTYDRFTCRDCLDWSECLKLYASDGDPMCEQAFENGNMNLFETYAEEYEDD